MGAQQDGFGPPQQGGRGKGGRPRRRGDRRQPADGQRPEPAAGERGPAGHERHQGDYGPVQRGGPLSGLATALPKRRLFVVALGVVTAALVYALALAVYTSMSMERTEVSGLSPAGLRLNVLVVGTDSREGLTPQQLQALGTERVGGDRPDTVLLLALRGGRAAMLSFPRDLLVTHCDGDRGRLNGAYASGGPSCLVETVTRTSGIPVTHYMEVNFLGFMQLVDALGGISVFLEEPIVDRAAGADLPAGCVTLNGQQAIGFVRARHGSSDLDRIARQQRFLGEVVDELTTPSTLLNPVRLFRVAGAAGDAVTADPDLGTVDLLRIARGARGFAGGGVATHTVPAHGARFGGASVLVPDEGQAEQLYASFRDGSVLRGGPEAPPHQPGGDVPAGGPPPPAGGGQPESPDDPQPAPSC